MLNFNSVFNELEDSDKSELFIKVASFFSEKIGSKSSPNSTFSKEKQQFINDMINQFSTKEKSAQPGYRTFRENQQQIDWQDEPSSFAPWEFFRVRFGQYPWQIMQRWFGSDSRSSGPWCCGQWF